MKTTDYQFLIPNDTIPELDAIANARETSGNNGGKTNFDSPGRHHTGVYAEYGATHMPAFKGSTKFKPQIAGSAINAFKTRSDGDTDGEVLEIKGTFRQNGGLTALRKKLNSYPDNLKLVLVVCRRVPEGILCTAVGWLTAEELRAFPDHYGPPTPAPEARQNEIHRYA